nr:PREDICTED: mitochondrial antiviral-signaling protein [Apteryx mantelli mantelli]
MGFAEDKVYDHILRNLSNFRNIHVTSLAHSLTCLTEADRDELQAREEMRGSHAAVFKFYQYLKCRRGWVTDLINALHQNNAGHLAEELQQLYDLYRLPPRPAEATPLQPPDLPKTPQTRPACSSGHGEPSGSFVDVRNPLLIQKQFDAEQKRLGMLGDRGGDGAAPPGSAPAPTGTYTSSGASLKPPLQEGKALEGQRAGSAPSVPTTEKVLPASAAPFLGTAVAGGLEDAAGRRSSPASHGGAEEDEEFSKPGVLLSMVEESPAVAGRCRSLQEPSTPYSGDSDRLELSSDPLMLSTDSSSPGSASLGRWSPAPAGRADPREEEATGASSRPPPNQDTSLGTHEVRVDHYPSVLLGAPQDLPERDNPFGNPPAFDSSTSSNSSQAKVPPRDSSGSSLSYIAPAAGIALISAVAFLVYARLQK